MNELKQYAEMIKGQLETTKKNINAQELTPDMKEYLHSEIKNIEDAIAGESMEKILETINKLNDTNTK